MKVVSQTQGS